MEIDLSIIISSFREEWVKRLIDSIKKETQTTTYEIIVVGPNKLDLPGVKSIQDFGHPTRCVQIGSLAAKGRYICWISDDGIVINNGLDRIYNEIEKTGGQIVLPYFEGENFSGNEKTHPPEYWKIHYHPALAFPNIPTHYNAAFMGCISSSAFKFYGGFDCRFEGINLSTVDLSVRLQNNNFSVYIPDFYVVNCDWSYMTDAANRGPVQSGFDQNDYPLFTQIYSHQSSRERIRIDYDNWTYNSSSVWERRFEVKRR